MTRDSLRRAAEAAQGGPADSDPCPVVIPTPRAHAPSVLGWLLGAAESAPPAVRYYLVAAKAGEAADPAVHGARPAVLDPEHYPEDAAVLRLTRERDEARRQLAEVRALVVEHQAAEAERDAVSDAAGDDPSDWTAADTDALLASARRVVRARLALLELVPGKGGA